jgi:hypothetical protein
MSSSFVGSDESFFVSNERFDTLISFAIEVARSRRLTPMHAVFVESFADARDQMYLGFDMQLKDHFPERAQRVFCAHVFSEVAQRISNSTIGNPAPPHGWRC